VLLLLQKDKRELLSKLKQAGAVHAQQVLSFVLCIYRHSPLARYLDVL